MDLPVTNINTLETILSRFAGQKFILYGDDKETLEMLLRIGDVLVVFAERANLEVVPVRLSYDKLFESIYDAIYVVRTTGNMGNRKVETSIMDILRNKDNKKKLIFLVGYPEFVTVGLSVVTELFEGGVLVGIRNDVTETLQETSEALDSNVHIPVAWEDIDQIPGVDTLLPYIHISSRIKELGRIPLTLDLPTKTLDLKDRSKMETYDPSKFTTARNWGQRKLLVAEIEMMNNVYKRLPEDQLDGVTFVYVGSAPGTHIPRLVTMFADKNPIFHLWDRIYATGRNNFSIQENDNIKIVPQEFRPLNYELELQAFIPKEARSLSPAELIRSVEGFFTDGVMRMYASAAKRGGIYVFVSDIRDDSSEEAVIADMERLKLWVLGMLPFASHLKFRLPFSREEPYTYLDGDLYTLAWSRNKSTEMRLLSFKPYRDTRYDTKDYDESCSYFNMVTRVASYDMSKLIPGSGKWIRDTLDGLCTCHDCAKEVLILVDYFNLLEYPVTEESVIAEIRENTKACNLRASVEIYRTLWNIVSVKIPPYDRKHLVLFKTLPDDRFILELNEAWVQSGEKSYIDVLDKSLDNIYIVSYNNVLAYGDGYSVAEIIGLMKQKGDVPILRCPARDIRTALEMEGCNEATDLLPLIVRGIEFTVITNFHSDYIKTYDPKKDQGSMGLIQYNRYILQISLARKQGVLGLLSLLAHLDLFAIPRATLKRR